MKDRTLLAQQIIAQIRDAVPHMPPQDRVSAALAVLRVPRIRSALEIAEIKEMENAQG